MSTQSVHIECMAKKLKPARLKVQKMEQLPTQIITLISMMHIKSASDYGNLRRVNKQFYTATKTRKDVVLENEQGTENMYSLEYREGAELVVLTIDSDHYGTIICNTVWFSGNCSPERLKMITKYDFGV